MFKFNEIMACFDTILGRYIVPFPYWIQIPFTTTRNSQQPKPGIHCYFCDIVIFYLITASLFYVHSLYIISELY